MNPRAIAAVETSIANLSNLRRSRQKTGVMRPGSVSFQDVQTEGGVLEQSEMDSEYGMPITEENERINTTQYNNVQFNVSQMNEAQNIMRSGRFGGLMQSSGNNRSESMEFNDASQHMSFSVDEMQSTGINLAGTQGNQLVSNGKLKKLAAKQRVECQPKIEGGNKYKLPRSAAGLSVFSVNKYDSSNSQLESSADELESSADELELEPSDMDLNETGIDQDFDFIEDDIAMFMTEI